MGLGGWERGWSRGPSRGAAAIAVAGLLAAGAPACSGTAQNPVNGDAASELDCLGTLLGDCCPTSGPAPTCIARFTEAAKCGAWATTTAVTVFATPCDGLTAVRTARASDTYASFYVYDATGALYAIGDDAGTAGAIECGAGPAGFLVPSACALAWVGQGAACTSGEPAASSVCD